MPVKLKSDFYLQNTKTVAQELLGKTLVRIYKNKILSGKIVETEAYLGIKDKAAHSYNNRKTPRTKTMYMHGGHTYVYFIYGMYYCLNAVTQKEGTPEAVLIRALEPIEGIEQMKKFRNNTDLKNLTSGPGKLCQALKIDKTLNAYSLNSDDIFILDNNGVTKSKILATPRIGVDYAEEAAQWKLRYTIKDNKFASK